MLQKYQSGICFFLGVIITVMACGTLCAQELGYSGLGPINTSFGGATVSVPLDGTGAVYWNPATIAFLDKGEFEFGFGRTNAPWFGDETLGYTLLIPVMGIVWAVENVENNYETVKEWIDGDGNPHQITYSLKLPKVRGFNLSYIASPSSFSQWNYGITLTETGARKQRLMVDETSGDIMGSLMYRIKTMELNPTLSWRNANKNFSLGLSGILSMDEFPDSSIPDIPGYDFFGESRSRFGLGLQLGAYLETQSKFHLGASVRTPQWIPGNTYQWYNGTTNDLRSRKMIFSQDSPLRIALGTSYSGIENLLVAVDVRYYDFQHVGALYDVSSNRSTRNVFSIGTGIQYHMTEDFIVRVGYQYSDASLSYEDLLFNTSLPIQAGHSIQYGFTFGDSDYWDISFAISHALNPPEIRIPTTSVPLVLEKNPNTSSFWWGLRIRF